MWTTGSSQNLICFDNDWDVNIYSIGTDDDPYLMQKNFLILGPPYKGNLTSKSTPPDAIFDLPVLKTSLSFGSTLTRVHWLQHQCDISPHDHFPSLPPTPSHFLEDDGASWQSSGPEGRLREQCQRKARPQVSPGVWGQAFCRDSQIQHSRIHGQE